SLLFLSGAPGGGARPRPATGWVSDRYGGGRVTLCVFAGMIVAVLGVIWFLGMEGSPAAFWGFFAMFMLLFFFTGVGNASTFQMIPVIMRTEIARLMPDLNEDRARRQADLEAAAIIAFTSAIGAYGGFFIPMAYGVSISATGTVVAALWGFLAFYVLCLLVTWAFYTRPGGLLHDIERRGARPVAAAQTA
ncbi:MAG: MFS transporter, partial [Alphaproteobacteria bacterium]